MVLAGEREAIPWWGSVVSPPPSPPTHGGGGGGRSLVSWEVELPAWAVIAVCSGHDKNTLDLDLDLDLN